VPAVRCAHADGRVHPEKRARKRKRAPWRVRGCGCIRGSERAGLRAAQTRANPRTRTHITSRPFPRRRTCRAHTHTDARTPMHAHTRVRARTHARTHEQKRLPTSRHRDTRTRARTGAQREAIECVSHGVTHEGATAPRVTNGSSRCALVRTCPAEPAGLYSRVPWSTLEYRRVPWSALEYPYSEDMPRSACRQVP
jgi:hypothetical protein